MRRSFVPSLAPSFLNLVQPLGQMFPIVSPAPHPLLPPSAPRCPDPRHPDGSHTRELELRLPEGGSVALPWTLKCATFHGGTWARSPAQVPSQGPLPRFAVRGREWPGTEVAAGSRDAKSLSFHQLFPPPLFMVPITMLKCLQCLF